MLVASLQTKRQTARNCLIAAPGNVAENVIIERQSESTIQWLDGARDAYLGYVTLKVSSSENPHSFQTPC